MTINFHKHIINVFVFQHVVFTYTTDLTSQIYCLYNKFMEIIDKLCELVHRRKFKQAETVLLQVLEETVKNENHVGIIREIYRSFNCYYYKWAKKNKINIDSERDKLNHQDHSNFLISHTRHVAEMDDLLYGLVSNGQKDEIQYDLRCYKMNLN